MPTSPDAAFAVPRPVSPALVTGHYPGVWLDAVEVRLAGDRDGDGHHSRLDVSLDVDTDAGYVQVYASVALIDGHGRLAVAHDTDAFGVDGRSFGDAVELGFELLDDFPTDRYSLYVEVRDARYGDALDGVGANELASLGGLRLEGTGRDGHGYGSGYGSGHGYGSGFAVGLSSGHGGPRDDGYATSYAGVGYAAGLDPLALLGLAAAAFAARIALAARVARPSRRLRG